ncbi:MAG TPA: hypothetical protein VJJ72_01670, partial [Candidatus Paceibacterota bacterium]
MNSNQTQQGSIIVFAVLIMGILLAISLTLAATFIPKIRASLEAGPGSVGSLYAADSAIEWCIYINQGKPAVGQPVMSNGATYTLTPGTCNNQTLNHTAVGSYLGTSRSLQVNF